MEQNAIKSTFGTKKETILYNTAAVIGRPGKEKTWVVHQGTIASCLSKVLANKETTNHIEPYGL